MRLGVPDSVIEGLESVLRGAGVVLWDSVKQVSRVISIKFEKHAAPLGLIAAVILGFLVVAALIISWQILKLAGTSVPVWLIAAGAIALGLLLTSKLKHHNLRQVK